MAVPVGPATQLNAKLKMPRLSDTTQPPIKSSTNQQSHCAPVCDSRNFVLSLYRGNSAIFVIINSTLLALAFSCSHLYIARLYDDAEPQDPVLDHHISISLFPPHISTRASNDTTIIHFFLLTPQR